MLIYKNRLLLLFPLTYSVAETYTCYNSRSPKRTRSPGRYRSDRHFGNASLATTAIRRKLADRKLRSRIPRQRRVHGVSILICRATRLSVGTAAPDARFIPVRFVVQVAQGTSHRHHVRRAESADRTRDNVQGGGRELRRRRAHVAQHEIHQDRQSRIVRRARRPRTAVRPVRRIGQIGRAPVRDHRQARTGHQMVISSSYRRLDVCTREPRKRRTAISV